MNTPIVTELLSSRLMMSAHGINQLEAILSQAQLPDAMPVEAAEDIEFAESMATPKQGAAIVVLPITGMMTKYSRYDYSGVFALQPGMDDIANALLLADREPSVTGTVLLINSPGGSVLSWIRIEEALRQRTKPCVAIIDGICASAAMYVASLCDKIIALNDVCEIGSIGVMAHIIDTRKAEEDYGIKVIEVYPPESKWKNRTVREALDGDTKLLIEEELSPIARLFQDHIRKNRPALDESVEGVLEGRMFYAQDALKAGLIDAIEPISDALDEVQKLAELREAVRNGVRCKV